MKYMNSDLTPIDMKDLEKVNSFHKSQMDVISKSIGISYEEEVDKVIDVEVQQELEKDLFEPNHSDECSGCARCEL